MILHVFSYTYLFITLNRKGATISSEFIECSITIEVRLKNSRK